jgi:hypothetical protein
LKEIRPLWPPQRGVGLREPNLGKTNPRVTLFICLRFVLHPLSRGLVSFLTLTRLVAVFIFVNFSFALFTPPPLGDYQLVLPKKKIPSASNEHSISFKTFDASYVLTNKSSKVVAKFVGGKHKGSKTCVWVPKVLVSNAKGPKTVWVPKVKN